MFRTLTRFFTSALLTLGAVTTPVAIASGQVQQGEVVTDASIAIPVTGPRMRLPQAASSMVPTLAVGGSVLIAGLGLLLWRRRQLTISH